MKPPPDPALSIVVVTYNAADFLPRTIASLLQQSSALSEVEVILVDGDSTDSTVSLARECGVFDTIVSENDAGIYDAMNKGAMLARATWLQFLNAGDTFSDAHALETVLDGLRHTTSPWAVARSMNLGGVDGSPREIPSVPHTWFRHAFGLQPHCHQACFFRRDLFNLMSGHSLAYGTAGDFDLILRYGALSPPTVIDRVCIHYLGGGVSEGTWNLSASLQHASRIDRLQLRGIAASIDLLWSRVSPLYLRIKVFGGGARTRMMSAARGG